MPTEHFHMKLLHFLWYWTKLLCRGSLNRKYSCLKFQSFQKWPTLYERLCVAWDLFCSDDMQFVKSEVQKCLIEGDKTMNVTSQRHHCYLWGKTNNKQTKNKHLCFKAFNRLQDLTFYVFFSQPFPLQQTCQVWVG